MLAACFDLLLTFKYYEIISNSNWIYCPPRNLAVYPVLNCCPFCALSGRFIYHEGNKPESGFIGPAAAQTLRDLFADYFHAKGFRDVMVAQGKEPIDVLIADVPKKKVFLAEIKAAPLYTSPLVVAVQRKEFLDDNPGYGGHPVGRFARPGALDASILLPKSRGHLSLWKLPPGRLGDKEWLRRSLCLLLEDDKAFIDFLDCWINLWKLYLCRDKTDSAYWLTSACGRPTGVSTGDWPFSPDGKAKGSISDNKTSVGMDRTDDIKKSTFQVLNLGVSFRRLKTQGWSISIGLVSNLHAGRHHEEYLQPYEDLVWGWGNSVSDAPVTWFNLFDGIVSFSASHTRNEWIRSLMEWS